jgi:hypothetical protein
MKKGVSKQSAFLAAFRLTASVTKAAEAARIDRRLHYDWLDAEPAYAQAFETAREEAAQALEDEAIRRAKEGIEEPVIYKGELCTEPILDENGAQMFDEKGARLVRPLVRVKYSNQLLTFLLKGFKPERYRDRTTVDVTGSLAVVVDRLAAARARLQPKDGDA